MDPLSISASVLTLLGAAGTVTITVKNLVQSLKTVDSRLTGLCDELADLQGYLQAIESTLKGCKQFDLSLVDDGLWQQSEIALANCRTTLEELTQLVEKIKDASWPRNLGWKVRVMIDMRIHDEELVAFREKVHQSNSALQTMLHIIVVSLSLRQNTSQDQILSELHQLKSSINKTWNASFKPIRGSRSRRVTPSKTAYRITHNLRHLAAAAESFYTAASSTASTILSDDGHANLRSPINSQISHRGYFPRPRYELVEQFLDNLPDRNPATHRAPSGDIRQTRQASLALTSPTPTDTDSIITPVTEQDDLYDDQKDLDSDEFLEDIFIDGLRELAVTTIKDGDYPKAIQLIKRVVISEFGSETGERGFREMYFQLILCYFCQGNWRLADPLVKILTDTNKTTERTVEEDLVIHNFSHALALGYLREYSLEEALRCCKQALLGKRKICKKTRANGLEYHETLALLATIYEVSGDCVRAEIYRRQLPRDFIYLHPDSEFEFLQSHKNVLATILGSDDVYLVADIASAGGRSTNSATAQESSLRLKLSQHDRDELDTDKIFYVPPTNPPAYEADDELSPVAASPNRPQHRPLRRQLTRFFKPGHNRYNTAGDGEEYDGMDAECPPANGSSSKVSPLRRFFNSAPLLKSRRRKAFQPACDRYEDPLGIGFRLETLPPPWPELGDTSRMELDDNWPTEATVSFRETIPLPAELDATETMHINRLKARVHLDQTPSQVLNQLPQQSSQPLPAELENITQQMTKTFASLNENGDLASLEAQERLLTALLPSFEALSSDQTIVRDAKVAMFCLRKKIATRYMTQDDSGYESAKSLGSSSSLAPKDIPLPPSPQHPSSEIPTEMEEALSIYIPKVEERTPLLVKNSCSSSSITAQDINLTNTGEKEISSIKRSATRKVRLKDPEISKDGPICSRPIGEEGHIEPCLVGGKPAAVNFDTGMYWDGTSWLPLASDLELARNSRYLRYMGRHML